ncbi:hypothetical protein C0Q70_16366 [Pomacea canaliculata]|uniref:Reelin domain-containing protein n=1 Tax=Pomacea canaliculata TaxID=400727 RepID=A0A2T7NPK4_POMCA|nr:hypothetical protein C0Q70_16366 [Pomacea canaliculata]
MFVQARLADDCSVTSPIGSFNIPVNDNFMQQMVCDKTNDAVSHRMKSAQNSKSFIWTPPPTIPGTIYFRPLGDSPSGCRSSRHFHLLVRLSRDVDRWSLIGSQGDGGVQQDDLLDRRVFGVPAAVGRQTKPSVLSCTEDICNDNVVCYKGHIDEGVVDCTSVRRMDCLFCSGADGRRVCCRCCSSIL